MWKLKSLVSIGGLENVGFVPQQDFLIVLSSNGEGIFDCLTGERIVRNNDHYEWENRFNEMTKTVKGFDLFGDIEIPTSGLHGSNIMRKESEGWLLQEQQSEIVLISPDGNRKVVSNNDVCELRAFGFSDTGKSFVVASGCELIIFSQA